MNALNNIDYDRSQIGVLVRDAKMFARLDFTSISFSYSDRVCNEVAHAMAALSASSEHGTCLLWPDDVHVFVAIDLAMHMV
jgi:hypothetical protein